MILKGPQTRRIALITGASSGLGAEFAQQLAEEGYSLVLVARREERLEELGRHLKDLFPDIEVRIRAVDLTIPDQRRALWEWMDEENLQPQFLVNNAGMGDYGEFISSSPGKVEAMLGLNLNALVDTTRQFLLRQPQRSAQDEPGLLIHVSSIAGETPLPDMTVYAATKAFVSSFSEGLRLEWKEKRVWISALCPGPVPTEFGQVARRNQGEDIPFSSKSFLAMSSEDVVRASLKGVHRNQARVYPGVVPKMLAKMARWLPRPLLRIVLSLRPRKSS